MGKRIGDRPGLKVGLAWAGGAIYRDNKKRSIALARAGPLANVTEVTFFSLQMGEAAQESASPPPGMTLVDLTSSIADFADTAAIISHLDLVITVDTAVRILPGQ